MNDITHGVWMAENGTIRNDETGNILAITVYQNQQNRQESIYNAELMAASPVLLECTQLFYEFLTGQIENSNFEEMCELALSKAGFPILKTTQSNDDWDNLPF